MFSNYITEVSVEDKRKWNDLVYSFTDFEVFYLNEYALAFMNENVKNGRPVLLYYENGEDRAVNVIFKRDIYNDDRFKGKIKENEFFDITTPYGYGGFWGNITDYKALNKYYNNYCISSGYICEFVRFDLFGEYRFHYDGETETRTHNVIRSLEPSLDSIWMDFKQKVRKNVKRANQNDLQILVENTDEHLNSFIEIYNSTMKRSEAKEEYYFSRGFYETLNRMENHVAYFYVLYKGEIISSELVICGAHNCYSYLGGTKAEYFELRPNDFLKYEIIKWAHKKGLKNFVLGGGYGADDGIFQYKASLAPKGIVDFYIGRKIFDKEAYDKLVGIRSGEELNEKFFPLYRC